MQVRKLINKVTLGWLVHFGLITLTPMYVLRWVLKNSTAPKEITTMMFGMVLGFMILSLIINSIIGASDHLTRSKANKFGIPKIISEVMESLETTMWQTLPLVALPMMYTPLGDKFLEMGVPETAVPNLFMLFMGLVLGFVILLWVLDAVGNTTRWVGVREKPKDKMGPEANPQPA